MPRPPIGDDRLQKRSQGYVVPDLHPRHLRAARALVQQGHAAQSLQDCDTFSTNQL